MEFTHLSKNNPYHLYNINDDKIIRDDMIMVFCHPDIIKCDYIPIPNLSEKEINAIILDLKDDPKFRSLAISFLFYFDRYANLNRLDYISEVDYTKKVKEMLKFIKRLEK